ncbi:MAG TPA: PQQ-binding-like beta-propeller repeat protein [Gammaproteobacteria bacterium]|nr:PQQ-binding-like beta-propeller repeat protein [Gammaproteobacteria bacterium]
MIARTAIGAILAAAVLLQGAFAAAQPSGADVYAARCARCHDAPDSHAPPRAALAGLSAARILRTLDFGTMMSVTYMLDRAEREAVAHYLGGAGDDRAPRPAAFCRDRGVELDRDRSDWNGWSPDPANTRFQADTGGLAEADVPRLTLSWAFGFEGDVNAFAPPAAIGAELFVGSAGGAVYALEAASGCIDWRFDADGPVRTAIAVDVRADRSTALFGDQIGNFYALDAATGRLLWRRRPDDHEAAKLTGAPLLNAGRVYVPVASWEESRPLNPEYPCCTFRGSVVAYDVADGALAWKSYLVTEEPKEIGRTASGARRFAPSGAGTWSAPTLDLERGRLYVTTGNNYTGMTAHSDAVVALDLETGRIVWSRQLTPGDEFNLDCRGSGGCPGEDSDFGASAVLARGSDRRAVLVAGQKSGVVYGLDPDADGAVLWQARVGKGGINGGVLWGMASDGENVYAAVSDLARRPRAGASPYDWRPADVDPAAGGGLTALRLADGARAWYAPPAACDPARPVCSPAQPAAVTAIPGVVFSGAVDGHMRAFAAKDGRVIWDFDTAREYRTVNGVPARGGSLDGAGPVVVGGRLYVTSGYARNGGMPGNVLLAFAPAREGD